MNTLQTPPASAPTFESVLASLQATDRMLSEKFAETALQMKETDRKMKELQKTVGSITNNYGCFAEEYFFNSFEKDQKNFFGERFDEIKKNLKGTETDDEYDILLLNDESLGIIEVKFKAHLKDVEAVLKKADTFRINFPKYKHHKIYLGLASMSFYSELEEACLEKGIAVIKQVGDTVVILDTGLKTY